MTFTIVVHHPPMGAPRMTRSDRWKQRSCVVRYRTFKDAIRLAFRGQPTIDPATVLSLSWLAVFDPPPSWSTKRREAALGTLHRQKPDRDNIDKAVLDALFEDDCAIASGTIEKRWGTPARIEITIVLECGVASETKDWIKRRCARDHKTKQGIENAPETD